MKTTKHKLLNTINALMYLKLFYETIRLDFLIGVML